MVQAQPPTPASGMTTLSTIEHPEQHTFHLEVQHTRADGKTFGFFFRELEEHAHYPKAVRAALARDAMRELDAFTTWYTHVTRPASPPTDTDAAPVPVDQPPAAPATDTAVQPARPAPPSLSGLEPLIDMLPEPAYPTPFSTPGSFAEPRSLHAGATDGQTEVRQKEGKLLEFRPRTPPVTA